MDGDVEEIVFGSGSDDETREEMDVDGDVEEIVVGSDSDGAGRLEVDCSSDSDDDSQLKPQRKRRRHRTGTSSHAATHAASQEDIEIYPQPPSDESQEDITESCSASPWLAHRVPLLHTPGSAKPVSRSSPTPRRQGAAALAPRDSDGHPYPDPYAVFDYFDNLSDGDQDADVGSSATSTALPLPGPVPTPPQPPANNAPLYPPLALSEALPQPPIDRTPKSKQNLYNAYLRNTSPHEPGSSCLCGTAAAVSCRTCDVNQCPACDARAHSGQSCRPHPHVRSTVDGSTDLGPKERVTYTDGVLSIGPLHNVFLHCAVACPHCGCRTFTPCGPVQYGKLTIVTASGRYDVDRVSFKCGGCLNIIDRGDPELYTTSETLPVSELNCETVYCRTFVVFLHKQRGTQPGTSAQASADALTLITKSRSSSRRSRLSTLVSGDHVRAVMRLQASFAEAAGRTIGAVGVEKLDTSTPQGFGTDADMKLRIGIKMSAMIADKRRRGVFQDFAGTRLFILDRSVFVLPRGLLL